jgi:hypothetical protein
MRLLVVMAAVAFSLGGCTVSGTTEASKTPLPVAAGASSPPMGSWSEPICPDSIATPPEIRGTASSGIEIWSLVFPSPAPRAGTDTKVIIRMTGSGEPLIYADGPLAVQIRPIRGPQGRLGSSWNRPGNEWGTFFTFPSAGCWNIRVVRATGRGSIPLSVSAGIPTPG